jgi:dihydrofolate reductase
MGTVPAAQPDRFAIPASEGAVVSPSAGIQIGAVWTLAQLRDVRVPGDDHVYVFGGAEVYAQTLDHADRLELTEVHAEPEGDTFFPAVDWSEWTEVAREHNDGFDFVTYERKTPR